MKAARLIVREKIFLASLGFLFFFSVFPAQAAIGENCQYRNTDTTVGTGTCVASGNCANIGDVNACDRGEVCCVTASTSGSGGAGTGGSIPATAPQTDQACREKSVGATCVIDDGEGRCDMGDLDGEPYIFCADVDRLGTTSPNVNGACGGGTCRADTCRSDEVSAGACTVFTGLCCVKKTSGGTGGGTGGTGGTTNTPQNQTINFSNPLAFNSVEGLLGALLQTLQRIIVVLAMIFLVIGAILYIISGGNESRMETGKKAITAAMIGLALGLAAPSFLREIGEVLGWGEVNTSAVAGARTLSDIALSVLNFLLSLVGILGMIMLIIGGLTYLTAYGDEDQIDTAKKMVKYAIIGIIVAFASLIIVRQIASFFGTV